MHAAIYIQPVGSMPNQLCNVTLKLVVLSLKFLHVQQKMQIETVD